MMETNTNTWCLGTRAALAQELGAKVFDALPRSALAFLAENGISLQAVSNATLDMWPPGWPLKRWERLVFHLAKAKEGDPPSPVLRAYNVDAKEWLTWQADGAGKTENGALLRFYQDIINQVRQKSGAQSHYDPFGPGEEAA